MRRWQRPERRKSALKNKGLLAVRYGLLAAALLCIAVGLMRREYVGVLQKAVMICLECIGIG